MNSFSVAQHSLKIVAALLALILLFQVAGGFLFAPPGHDGSYYLSHARYVHRGLTPYRDFPTPYAPGPYYLSAWVGDQELADPVRGKLPMYLAHLVCGGLLFLALRRLGHERSVALACTVVGGLWVIACGGDRLFLEPMQNAFALLSFAILLYNRLPVGCTLAGLAAGCALMMKQLSLPAIPGLLVLSLAPAISTARPDERSWTARLAGAAAFLVSVGVPFLAYVLVVGLDFFATFRHMVSFGGQGGSYGNFGWREFYAALVERPAPALLPLYTCFACGAWLLIHHRTWETAALAALFGGFFLVLFIQPHVHYAQLCIPWGILLMAETGRQLFRSETSSRTAAALVGALAMIWFVPGMLVSTRESVRYVKNRPFNDLRAIADDVAARVPVREKVFIVNAPWLYLLDDITPPGREHLFVRGRDLGEKWVHDLARGSDYAVLVPYGHTGRLPMDKARAAMEASGLTQYDSLPVDTEELGDERSLPDAAILFFRRISPAEGR